MGNRRLSVLLITAVLLTGCSFAPVYHPPVIETPATFKEGGAWQPATPADRINRDGWWKLFRDPTLDQLETRLNRANPTIAVALARHDEAAAELSEIKANRFPTLQLGVNGTRSRAFSAEPRRDGNQVSTYSTDTIGVGLDYDLDLWGKVRNAVEAGEDALQAQTDDLAAVRLSMQASLAKAYFRLRESDSERRLLNQTIDAAQRAVTLTQNRHAGGIASGLDVSRAQTQLDSLQAKAQDIVARRALIEHVIATLVGVPPASFTLAPAGAPAYLPAIPTGLPTTLLQRRPDVAAAERRVAQANAQIGVASAAFFPDVTLGLAGGFQSDALMPWMTAPNAIWAIGPQLVMNLFDGGQRRAVTQAMRAKLAENGARYKVIALRAFEQVEDNLARLHHLGDEAAEEDKALAAARHTLDLAMSRYRDGVVSYLEVVTAQTTELDTDMAVQKLETRRLCACTQLIEALGGGWRPLDIDSTPPNVSG
ncbi:RND efflux system, outer membrane lipoprotein, NodT family [Burkholderia ambifaria IOP40-10]|uniref:RND efflux system, outer membrane lipoprotein, NodT family n=1 Tax=Burkholderia ambifaria IOP40-10 TaxID=396596 RepID=B1FE87_9BURK|nr:efflux transporter outer membrane subunit [Burkholderia ambifaria]EDT04114.1 RND efflux system, outer membrane lipoprotein, NodT family [Burkholderia ambifaria IOP40-10]